jgi:hypothetical protein
MSLAMSFAVGMRCDDTQPASERKSTTPID